MTDLEILRGIFPDSLYLGGSTACYKALEVEHEHKDIDLFVLGKRRFESWALIDMLEQYFDVKEMLHGDIHSTPYLIKYQFKHLELNNGDNKKIDLMFIDCTEEQLVHECTASTLSKFYYKIDYTPSKMHLIPESKIALADLQEYGTVSIDATRAAEKHVQKILNRSKILGYKIHVFHS